MAEPLTRPIKVAVFADGDHIQRFALDALDAVEGCAEISLFSCTNTRTRKRLGKHGLYYALNLVSVRNRWTRGVPIAQSTKRIAETVSFETDYEGMWQVLPAAIVDRLREGGYDVILKFGMSLLRVPPHERLPVPILSYHHGDPDLYRGRPAGFWEMKDGRSVMGQIVQVIGNRLDAGQVVAFAETKVHAHSYKATLVEAFRHSPLLINTAIRNAIAGTYLAKPCQGRNYRLPSHLTVLSFVLTMMRKLLGRLVYGAVFEKKWRVSTAPAPAEGAASLFTGAAFPEPERWRTIEPDAGFTFYADPFFSARPPGILVEGLNRRTGLGEIVLVADGAHRTVSDLPGHASYPFVLDHEGEQLVVPETAGCRPLAAYRLEGERLAHAFDLEVEGAEHILDPTLIEQDGLTYLFGNVAAIGSNALYLWVADRVDRPFRRHPASPLLVSPSGGRMGGPFLREGGRLIRIAQDYRASYGDGLLAFEVEALTPRDYRERPLGSLTLARRQGPHTLGVRDGEILFDWYDEKFAPGAGLRRFSARLARRRQAAR